MSEPTITCENCETDLPAKVYEAGTFLYHQPATLTGGDLAAKLEIQLDISKALSPLADDTFIGQVAISSFLDGFLDGFESATLIAAVRHYGSLHGAQGSQCDRIVYARWCHEPTPDYQGVGDPRPPFCQLAADHKGDHDFSDAPETTVAA